MNQPLTYILKQLLTYHSIHIDERELSFQLESHPSYPSLHALSGVLDHFSIKNIALEVPNTSDTLNSLPDSFIAHCHKNGEEQFVQVIKDEATLTIVYASNRKEIQSIESFLKDWTGVVFAVSSDKNDESLERALRKPMPLIGVIFGLSVLFFFGGPSLYAIAHFILSLAGVALTMLILEYDLGKATTKLRRFCSPNEQYSCEAVLNTKGSRLLGIKLQSIGIVYFASIAISWLINSLSYFGDGLFVILSGLAIPFTIYAVYYQYAIVKKWCPLCLGVTGVLWLQALSVFLLPDMIDVMLAIMTIDGESISMVISVFLISASCWSWLLPKLELDKTHHELRLAHQRFKRNFMVFKSLLIQSPFVDYSINYDNEIVFGDVNNEPLVVITMVTNPLCGHCREVHQVLEEIKSMGVEHVQLNVKFNVNVEQLNREDVLIAKNLLHIFHHKGQNVALEAFHDLYVLGLEPHHWLTKWEQEEADDWLDELQREKKWCEERQIHFTPALLINGSSFPDEYNRSDLPTFIETIVEEAKANHASLVVDHA